MNSLARSIPAQKYESKVTLGFWIYLMTDCVLFASLFATYAVLRNNTFGGPAAGELFDLPYVLIGTLLLLSSSFSCGLALIALRQMRKKLVIALLSLTFIFGAAFLGLELNEFSRLIESGNSWQRSGFLSAFYTLVGVHGLHIASGLIWVAVLIAYIGRRGLTPVLQKRLTLFSLFWHFLDIIWIFIFTFVYLMGAV